MSLPIICIFENHWDVIPKHVCQELIRELSAEGYDTFGFEAPQEMTPAAIMDECRKGLELMTENYNAAVVYLRNVKITDNLFDMDVKKLTEILRLYVSSQRYCEVAEQIKNLPAARVLQSIFREIQQRSFLLQGMDVSAKDFRKILKTDFLQRTKALDAQEELREGIMLANITRIRSEREGSIFLCGAKHAPQLIAKFKEKGMADDILCYWPHNTHQTYDIFQFYVEQLRKDEHSKDRVFPLSEKDVKPFCKRVVEDVVARTKYQEEVHGNSHAEFLSKLFKVHFRAFVRPGHYVDALVDVKTPEIESIRKRIHEVRVQMRDTSIDGHRYLVVRAVNTRPVAESIRTLKPIG